MKIYTVHRVQFLPITIKEAWNFFASPNNLVRITPRYMGFSIRCISGEGKMYAGQLIQYKINVLPYVKVQWVTEITHIEPYRYFIDEQRFGPYKMWHHQHHFQEVSGGIEMRDEVYYTIPWGLLGRVVNWLFVERRVNAIFDYRYHALYTHFYNQKDSSPV